MLLKKKYKLIRHAMIFRIMDQKEISERIEKLVIQGDDLDFIEQRKLFEQLNKYAKDFDSKKFDIMINDFKNFFSYCEKIKEKLKKEHEFKKKVKEFIDLLHLRSLDEQKIKFEGLFSDYKYIDKKIKNLLSKHNTTVKKKKKHISKLKKEKNTLKLKINASIGSYNLAQVIQKEMEDWNVELINKENLIKYLSKKLVIRQAILEKDDLYKLLTEYLKDYTTFYHFLKNKKHFSRTSERKKEIITLLNKKTSDLFLLKNNKLPENVDRLFDNFLLKMNDEARNLKIEIENLEHELVTIKSNIDNNLALAKKNFLECYFILSGKNVLEKSEKLLLASKERIDKSKRHYHVDKKEYVDIQTIKDMIKKQKLDDMKYKLAKMKNDIPKESYMIYTSVIADLIYQEFMNEQLNKNLIFIINNSPTKKSNKLNIVGKFPVTEFKKNYYYVLTLNKTLNKSVFQYHINEKNQVKLMSADSVEKKKTETTAVVYHDRIYNHESNVVIKEPINLELNTYDILLHNRVFKEKIIHEFVKITDMRYVTCNTTKKYQIISFYDNDSAGMRHIKSYLYNVKKQVFTGRVIFFNDTSLNNFCLHFIFRKKVNFKEIKAPICTVHNIKII